MRVRHFVVIALLGFIPPALAASKKGEKGSEKVAADPAWQSKALSIFMGVASDYCRADSKGFAFPTYGFSEEKKGYELEPTQFVPCGDVPPALLLDGVATALVLSTDAVPNYDTAHEAGSVLYRYSAAAEEADKASRQLLGKPLVAKRVNDKNGYNLTFYNPDAFEAAFRKFYFKPSETRGGVLAQKLYDAVFKQTLASYAESFSKVMEKKKLFVERAKEMIERAQKEESFYGNDFARQVGIELTGAKPGSTEAETAEPIIDTYLLGTMLRRQADGTLPVMLNSLKTVLKDYDPEAYKKFGSKL